MNENEDVKAKAETVSDSTQLIPKVGHAKRQKVMRRVVAPIFACLALMCLVGAGLSLTVLKPSRFVKAQTALTTQYAVTQEGVANLIGDRVQVSVQAPGEVCIALSNSTDTQGWLKAQGKSYESITGLKSWNDLAVSKVSSRDKAQKSVQFKNSDLWQDIKCAKKSASIDVTSTNAYQSIIAYSKSGITNIQMTWTRPDSSTYSQATPWFAMMTIFIVCAVLSATWLASADPFGAEHRKLQKAAQEAALRKLQENGEIPGGEYQPYKKKSKTGITHRNKRKGFLGRLFAHDSQESDSSAPGSAESSKPVVVDPSSVNLVASTGVGASDTSWSPVSINYTTQSSSKGESNENSNETTNLTGEELLEYLARLTIQNRAQQSQESGNAQTTPHIEADGTDEAQHTESNE